MKFPKFLPLEKPRPQGSDLQVEKFLKIAKGEKVTPHQIEDHKEKQR